MGLFTLQLGPISDRSLVPLRVIAWPMSIEVDFGER